MLKQPKAKAKPRLKTYANHLGAIQAEHRCSENKYDFRDDVFAMNDMPFDVQLDIHFQNFLNTYGERIVMEYIRDLHLPAIKKYLNKKAA